MDLTFRESAGLDAARLGRLYRRLGERDADHVLCDAMEALALALARIGRAFDSGDLVALQAQAAEIRQVARKIGMEKLGRVATDVAACAARGPSGKVALAATMARLARIGDISLSAVWDPKDQSL